MKTGTDEERTRCLHCMQGLATFLLTFENLLLSLLAPCSGGSDPPCLVLPVCDFPILPLELITDLELTIDFILSTTDLGLTTDHENSLTGV